MDSDINKSHIQLEFMKEFTDSHMSLKMGAGSHSFSMMQSLNAKLMAGFEMFYIPHQKEVHMCLGANYNHDIHSFYA